MTFYNRLTSNPFIVYSLTWLLVLGVYSLGWSYLLPPLSNYFIIFLLSTIIIAFLIGYYFYKKKSFKYLAPDAFRFKSIQKTLIVLYLLLAIEFVAVKNIPILGYLNGTVDVKYTEFGLPFIHVIVANGFNLCILVSYYSYLVSQNKRQKHRYILVIIFSFLPFVLMFNRGGIMYGFMGCTILYFMYCKTITKSIIRIGILSLFVLYLFGLLGNIRTDVKGVNNLILEIGEATPQFQNSSIPKELFWPYMYIASPLASARIMNDKSTGGNSIEDYRDMFLFEFTPQIISKRVSDIYEIERKPPMLISKGFTVSSVYGYASLYLGWFGPILMFVFSIFFIIVSLGIIPNRSPYYPIALAEVSLITIMNAFDNMFIFMGLVPQLFMLILLCRKFKIPFLKTF